MTLIGEERKIHRAYRFLVEVDDIGSGKFTTCSALETEAEETMLREGGDPVGIKVPGLITVSDVTLTRGVADYDLFEWFKQVYDYTKQGGVPDEELMRNAEVVQLDRDQSELRRWALYFAWPKKLKVGEWDNNSSDPQMEEVVLSIRGFDRVQNNA